MSNANEILENIRADRFTSIGVYEQNPGPIVIHIDWPDGSGKDGHKEFKRPKNDDDWPSV